MWGWISTNQKVILFLLLFTTLFGAFFYMLYLGIVYRMERVDPVLGPAIRAREAAASQKAAAERAARHQPMYVAFVAICSWLQDAIIRPRRRARQPSRRQRRLLTMAAGWSAQFRTAKKRWLNWLTVADTPDQNGPTPSGRRAALPRDFAGLGSGDRARPADRYPKYQAVSGVGAADRGHAHTAASVTGPSLEHFVEDQTLAKCWCRKRDSNPRPRHYE